MEKAKSMKTNQMKITTASSTVTKTRKKEDGKLEASRRGHEHLTEYATTAGRRIIDAETAGVKGAKANANVNTKAKGATRRVSMDTKVDTTTTTAATREGASL